MPQILGTARVAHGNRHVPHALWVPPLQRLHEVRVTGHTRFQQRQVLRCTVLRQSVDNRHCHEVFVQITCRFRSAINKVLQWYKGIYVTETCRRELSNLNENSRIFCFKKFPCRFQDSQSVITSFSQCYMWLCTIIYHLRAVAWSRSFDTSRANSLYVNQDKWHSHTARRSIIPWETNVVEGPDVMKVRLRNSFKDMRIEGQVGRNESSVDSRSNCW